MPEVNGIKVPFIPIQTKDDSVLEKVQANKSDFKDLFQVELEKIKFSNHAAKRLEARNIKLDEDSLYKLQDAIDKAESKGAKDSLVMMNNTAYIVNIPNRVVVTALPIAASEENVFTNIDSVVFAF